MKATSAVQPKIVQQAEKQVHDLWLRIEKAQRWRAWCAAEDAKRARLGDA